MSRAEGPQPARSGRGLEPDLARARGRAVPVSIGATLVLATLLPLLLVQRAAADPLSNARAAAAQITAQIQSEGQHLDILSQQYDAAQQRVQQLAAQVQQIQAQIAATKQKVATDQLNLRRQAVNVYINGTDSGLDGLFAGASTKTQLAQEYRGVAASNLSSTIDALHEAEATLTSQQTQLQTTQTQAQAAADQVAAARQSAQATEQQQKQTLSQVQGQIATLVAQQQAAEQRAQELAFQARVAAEAAAAKAAATASGPSKGTVSNAPVAPGASGAVQAAKSQLGTPYVWGAEDPGVGFDCSGLTQWSWGQAGVSIPRTAQEQYDAIVHVPLSDLRPGDLVFWDDGTSSVQHVAMYVGNDTVIQAPQTGETVSYATIWDNGLVGAGRP